MRIFIFSLLVLTSAGFTLTASQNFEEKYGDELTSRFIIQSDPIINSLVGIEIRKSWWSRPHEYAWAVQFVDKDTTALDAACGISHPFKWEIGQRSKAAWALDSDPRISDLEAIIQETYDDLGETAYAVLTNSLHLYHDMHVVRGSIFALPEDMPQFERIFCISTLEHLLVDEREKTMQEFAKHLTHDGLLVLTVDYPEIKPDVLIEIAEKAGLVPAGKTVLTVPENYLTNGSLSIYRAVFMHKSN